MQLYEDVTNTQPQGTAENTEQNNNNNNVDECTVYFSYEIYKK